MQKYILQDRREIIGLIRKLATDRMLSKMNVGGRYTIWQSYGGGLKATAEET